MLWFSIGISDRKSVENIDEQSDFGTNELFYHHFFLNIANKQRKRKRIISAPNKNRKRMITSDGLCNTLFQESSWFCLLGVQIQRRFRQSSEGIGWKVKTL